MVTAGPCKGRLGRLVRWDVLLSGQHRIQPVVQLYDGPLVRVPSVTVVR
jgi:hypothetical protein